MSSSNKKIALSSEASTLKPEDKAALEAASKQIEDVIKEQLREVTECQAKHNKRKLEVYEERKNAIAKIDKFWCKTFMKHPVLKRMLRDSPKEDLEILGHLKDFQLEMGDDLKSVKFTLTFDDENNKFFKNISLSKEYDFHDPTKSKIQGTSIEWAKKPEDISFFEWFEIKQQDEDEDDLDPIFGALDEIWSNPIKIFKRSDEDDDDDDDYNQEIIFEAGSDDEDGGMFKAGQKFSFGANGRGDGEYRDEDEDEDYDKDDDQAVMDNLFGPSSSGSANKKKRK